MLGSLLKVALSPVDLALSATKDLVNVVTVSDEKELGEETGGALDRLTGNLRNAFDPDE